MSKLFLTVSAWIVLSATTAAAHTPAQKCEADKNKVAGKYAFCRQKAESKAIRKGVPADYMKCDSRLLAKWAKIETRAAGACPDMLLDVELLSFVATHADDVAAALAGALLPDCPGDLTTCSDDLAACQNPTCGNDVSELGEQCDGTDLNGASCSSLGYDTGTLVCDGSCTLDASACELDACQGPTCGNNVSELGEQCDGTDLNGASCSSLGYDTGTLACDSSCTFDSSSCAMSPACGNDVAELGEQCDGTDLNGASCASLGHAGGTLACDSFCAYNASGCGPTKRVFATAATYAGGNIGGLPGGDSKCQAAADAAGLGGTWRAWLSDSFTDAKDRIPDAVYVLVDGTTVVADSLADLLDCTLPDECLDNPIEMDENGLVNTTTVWTGTGFDGELAAYNCGDWNVNNNGWAGVSYGTSGGWTSHTFFLCDSFFSLYCFEQ